MSTQTSPTVHLPARIPLDNVSIYLSREVKAAKAAVEDLTVTAQEHNQKGKELQRELDQATTVLKYVAGLLAERQGRSAASGPNPGMPDD